MHSRTSYEHSKYYPLFEINGTKIQNGSYHCGGTQKLHASAMLRLNRYYLDLHHYKRSGFMIRTHVFMLKKCLSPPQNIFSRVLLISHIGLVRATSQITALCKLIDTVHIT
jgi:hypothetical protein